MRPRDIILRDPAGSPPAHAGQPARNGIRGAKDRPASGVGERVLIASSGIQFLDLVLDRAAAEAVSVRYFECPAGESDEEAEGPSLHQVDLDEAGVFYHPITGEVGDAATTYAVSGARALEAFAGEWVPLPVLRLGERRRDGTHGLEEGPTNWARLWVAPPGPAVGAPWRLVIAFDTALDQRARGERVETRCPTAPDAADVAEEQAFAFTADVEAIGAFVNEPWVDEWLAEAWRARRGAAWSEPPASGMPGGTGAATAPALAHLAHYLTLLAVVAASGQVPRLFLRAPTAAHELGAVTVDLIIDLGASRTAAFLAETPAEGGRALIGELGLRDLGRPTELSGGIFPSRIEFARASLGRDVYSRWSGRTSAFYWPSLVRTGAEAMRLAAEQPASDALTGLSSPMSYLCDDRASRGLWRFAGGPATAGRRYPLVSGPQLAHLTETGDVIGLRPAGEGENPAPATKPRFSRASLLTLAAAEIILHAVSQANSIAWRDGTSTPDHPRRIGRIVVTLPATIEANEAARAIERLEAAVRLVWTALGWREAGDPLVFAPPAVVLGPDTATAAQLAFLENEIGLKLGGRARQYLELIGRSRSGRGANRALRIATLDVGGASSGIGVRAWQLDETGAIATRSLLSEGFRTGGDDVARALAEGFLVPALARRLAECKVADPWRLLRAILSSGDGVATTRQEELRRRFANEIALPVALALLGECETVRTARGDSPAARTIADLIGRPSAGALSLAEEMEALAADEGADGFDLLRTEVEASRSEVILCLRRVLARVLDCGARVIANLGADIVLLTGWLGRLPAIREALLEGLPLRPDRVIAVTEYRIGDWFPGRTPAGNVADGKSLAAVGAVLATRPQPLIGGNPLKAAGGLRERPETNAFVGAVGGDGLIAADAVLFETGPAEAGRPATVRPSKAMLAGEPPFLLGARRAPIEAWPALPLYRLELAEMSPDARPRLPLRLTLGWQTQGGSGPGTPVILRALDADGIDLGPGEIEVRLDTLGQREGHWLDTGELRIEEPLVQP